MTTAGTRPETATARMPYAVMAICGGAIAFDGYDLVVYGATLSSLREEWNLDPATAGLLGSVPLIGMLLGAMLVGSAAARFGRRTMFLATVAFFSALMAITAAASGPELFALLRFFAGLGLGGVMPWPRRSPPSSLPREGGTSATSSCSPAIPSAGSWPRCSRWHSCP